MPLLDRGWQLKMLEDRERHVLDGAIRRLRRGAETPDVRPFDVFNDVQDHVLRTAQTHVDRIVMEAFVAGIERATDAGARALLERVCDLYALTTIEDDRAWFLEHGRLTATRSKALTATVNALLEDLRPHMVTLVDAFAIPEDWKGAAILREEPRRQEAMATHDTGLRRGTATSLEVPPGQ